MKTEFRSVISAARRYEIEVHPFLGVEGGFVGSVWETHGTARVHCATIEYGQTEKEVNHKIDQWLVNLQLNRTPDH